MPRGHLSGMLGSMTGFDVEKTKLALRRLLGGVVLVVFLTCSVSGAGTQSPVLLLYGFQPVPGFSPPDLWASFATQISGRPVHEAIRWELSSDHGFFYLPRSDDDHRDVFIGDYGLPLEPTFRCLRYYASRVEEEIAAIRDHLGVPGVSIVAHSMGGLIARCYIEQDDFAPALGTLDFPDYGTSYQHDVDVLITLATPHHGTKLAAIAPSWAFGILTRQLHPDSMLLELLNQRQPNGHRLAPDIRHISMAGQTCLGCGLRRDPTPCLEACIEDGLAWAGSDLVVLMASALLDEAETTACIGFDHVSIRSSETMAHLVAVILNGGAAPVTVYASQALRACAEATP